LTGASFSEGDWSGDAVSIEVMLIWFESGSCGFGQISHKRFLISLVFLLPLRKLFDAKLEYITRLLKAVSENDVLDGDEK